MFRSPTDVSIKQIDAGAANSSALEEYYCDLCEQGPWATESDVEIHRKSFHRWYLVKTLKEKNSNMCSICLRDQTDKQSLIEHILVNHLCCPPDATRINRKIFICDYCQRLFFNKQLLINHIYHWHTRKSCDNKAVKINCPKCWKNIKGKSIWFHLLYHGAFSIGTCPICLRTCENNMEMIEHIKTHPSYFSCEICGYETTKLSYLNKHMEMHKKSNVKPLNFDVGRYFLPQRMYPSIKNRMNHVFKGIPLSNMVHICVMCRALCVTKEEMREHIQGDHMPEEEVKTKTHMCVCGEEFFNSVLLKHHIFKLKELGEHRVWDGATPIVQAVPTEEPAQEILYELYQISDPTTGEEKEIIIAGLQGSEATTETEQDAGPLIIKEYQSLES